MTSNSEDKTLISISIPVYNEEDNIARLYDELCKFTETEAKYRFEFLFTDNASKDTTFEKLAVLAKSDFRIRVLCLSRNFGFQQSILTNFLHARGAAAIQIDADLQDPPRVISEFLRSWEQGYKVVYGIRRRRKEFFAINIARKAYYSLVSSLSHVDLPKNAGDFRLIDRKIIEHLRGVDEQSPYLRGIIAGLGYSQIGIPYDRDARVAGSSKFGFFKLIEFAIDGLTSQSTRPLRMMTVLGFITSIGSLAAIAFYLIYYFGFRKEMPSGFMTLLLLQLMQIGIFTLFLGLLGEYVGRIFNNTRGLPLSIIEKRIEPPTSDNDDTDRTV